MDVGLRCVLFPQIQFLYSRIPAITTLTISLCYSSFVTEQSSNHWWCIGQKEKRNDWLHLQDDCQSSKYELKLCFVRFKYFRKCFRNHSPKKYENNPLEIFCSGKTIYLVRSICPCQTTYSLVDPNNGISYFSIPYLCNTISIFPIFATPYSHQPQ